MKRAVDQFGHVDVLFNNAGVFAPKPFLEVTEAEFDRFLDGTLKGTFFTSQAAAKAMKVPVAAAALCKPGRCGHYRRLARRHRRHIPLRRPAYTP